MLIVGAKGFAKEILEICVRDNNFSEIVFFDDISLDIPDCLFGKFKVLRAESQVVEYFKETGNMFSIGIGSPHLRFKMFNKFTALGGQYCSTISKLSNIGTFDVKLGSGVNILDGVCISNSVDMGIGTMVYYNSVITHDCIVGKFVEISPSVTILGGAKIGDFSHIGANSVIFPNLEIGKNVIVGSGAVVRQNLPDNCVAVGVPAKIIK